MNQEELIDDNKIPYQFVYDELENGIIIIKNNQILYFNNRVKEFIDSQLINKLHDLSAIFPKDKFGNIYQVINKLMPGESQKIYLKNYSDNLDFELHIIRNQDIDSNLIYLVFKKCNYSEKYNSILDYYLLDQFPFILLETNKEGKIIRFNKQFENQLYYSESIVQQGLLLTEIFTDESKPQIESILKADGYFKSDNKIEVTVKKINQEQIVAKMYFQSKVEKDQFDGLVCILIDNSQNKQLEIKFHKNQQRLRKILDLVPHMISLKDDKGNILLANKACADFYQKTTKDLVYSNISNFHFNNDDCERLIAQDKEVIESNESREWKKFELTDNFNNKKTFNTTKVPFLDPENGQLHSLGIMVDITQQQLDQLETLEAKEKYRILVERGSDGIVILQENKIAYANNQAARMFGYPTDEFIEKPLDSLLQTNQLQKTINEFEQNSQNKDVGSHYEMRIFKKDNSFGYLEAKINTINYLGKKSKLIFLRDVTNRKLAEQRSERYKNMLEQAHKIAKIGSWEFNLQNKSFHCSDEIYSIVEIEKEDNTKSQSNWFSNFIPQSERVKIYRGLVNSINTGIKYEIEFPIISHNGNRKIVKSQSQVFFDDSGKPETLIGTWIDISDQIKFQQVLKEAKLKAEESDNLKSAFLANMSHEIRTPMNAILGFANLLKSRNIDDKTHLDYIDHILQSGEGLIKLINDIIDISKIESNQLVIEKSPVKINELLDQIYNRYEEILLIDNNNNIGLKVEKALHDPDFTVHLDSFRLQQVISYLMTNAIKFTPHGTVNFGYSITNSELLFYVKDQGIGIPENKRELIFRSFSKLEGPQRMNKSGTGLGLSISKSLVELMGGKIWFETAENAGTNFFFTIPLEYAQLKSTSRIEIKNTESTKDFDLKDKSILIAEDEWLNYKLLEVLLKRTGATIYWAKNGLEAIDLFTNNKIDLVFMDIKMPEMNGYEATKAIKIINPTIPIIAQTAFTFSNEQQYILQSGCDMYLTKPLNHIEVFKALNNFLNQ